MPQRAVSFAEMSLCLGRGAARSLAGRLLGLQPEVLLAASTLTSLAAAPLSKQLPAYYTDNRKLQVFCRKCLFTSYISQTTY